MNSWMKLTECKSAPSSIFTIFDYTKLVYPIDSAFCLREITTMGQKPSFIEIDHPYDKILGLYSIPNKIVTVESNNSYYSVYFYDMNENCQSMKLNWELEQPFEIRSTINESILIVIAMSLTANQVIAVDCEKKKIISRGFFDKTIKQIKNGPYELSLSILTSKGQIVLYAFQSLEKGIGRIYKDRSFHESKYVDEHCWVGDELIIRQRNTIKVIVGEKVCQVINDFMKPRYLHAIICGFLFLEEETIKIHKKIDTTYSFVSEIEDPSISSCQNLTFSPQEDIMAYFCSRKHSIIYSTTILKQIQNSTLSKQKQVQKKQILKKTQICHHPSDRFKIYHSKQPWFVVSNGPQLFIYSSKSYECFLQVNTLKEEEEQSMYSQEVKIRALAIHPNRPMIAIAFDKKIKIYYILFNEFRVLKEISCSQCSDLIFSNSGFILLAIVKGKSGTKAYLFKINQVENDFSLVESISMNRNVISFCWNSLDNSLYAFHSDGYYEWNNSNNFKVRNETLLKFNFEIMGGTLADEKIILWGQNNLALVKNDEVEEEVKTKHELEKILKMNDHFFFVLKSGKICKNKRFDLFECENRGFDLKTKGKDFKLLPLQQNKFILMTHQHNLRFYEWAKMSNEFSEMAVIEKQKIYRIFNQYEEYEDRIKVMSERLNLSLEELRYEFEMKLKERQEEYKKELQNRINTEKMLKDEKMKLQILIQKNLEIKDKEAMHQIKDLQRLYERKIALTTNKLLTTTEMAFRDKLLCDQNLKELEEKHHHDLLQVRKEYGHDIQRSINSQNEAKFSLFQLKKQYETRIYELEQENEILLKNLQDKSEDKISYLKKTIVEWEVKYRECLSKKDNVDQKLHEQLINIELLKEKIGYLELKKIESDKRCQYAFSEIKKYEGCIEERNKVLECYEKRIEDLEKSNQILKYRVHELKNVNDPQEEEIKNLKVNLLQLEEEHQKISQHSHEQEQVIEILKKQRKQLKQQNSSLNSKNSRVIKTFEELVEKVRETAKMPIQTIRTELVGLVERYSTNESKAIKKVKGDSPLGELNRIRDHLQVCLDEVVTINKKNDEQRKKEIVKKNVQNTELLTELNELRRKMKNYEMEIKEKDKQIQKLTRKQFSMTKASYQKQITVESHSKELTKTKARESFYEKNLYKSYWRQKRLKTEEGSRRKKSAYSMIRDKSQHGPLLIQAESEDVEEYKRIIEQKDIYIKRLISKIQNG